jgi:hypothetical protein
MIKYAERPNLVVSLCFEKPFLHAFKLIATWQPPCLKENYFLHFKTKTTQLMLSGHVNLCSSVALKIRPNLVTTYRK